MAQIHNGAMLVNDVLVFSNPISGKGKGKAIAHRLASALGEAGLAVTAFTQRASSIDRTQFGASPLAAVVIGGDGTLRAVTERLIDVYDDSTMPPIAVIPLGTANLMGRHLGLRWRGAPSDRIVAAIRRRRIRRIDAARANGRLFLLMAGVGIDGQVVHELDAVRKGPIDYVSYVLPAVRALAGYRYPAIRVTIDGKRRFGPKPGIAFVGNVAEYGTGFPLLKHARSDDGLLDVCVLPCASRGDAIRLLMRAAVGEHVDLEGALYTTGHKVRIDANHDVPVQVDGDASGHTPLEIELLDRRVPFIVE
ncbi:MAG: hypothetical protein JO353_05585 [Phycisphaerae bacterium]|nr:hypothetical protein [Phycisphaerae bacterium]